MFGLPLGLIIGPLALALGLGAFSLRRRERTPAGPKPDAELAELWSETFARRLETEARAATREAASGVAAPAVLRAER